MGEWTWLHALFPLADVEFVSRDFKPRVANVLVRTIRHLPDRQGFYQIRVAPHNVAPFRGGPWFGEFAESELNDPGEEFAAFRKHVAEEVQKLIQAKEK